MSSKFSVIKASDALGCVRRHVQVLPPLGSKLPVRRFSDGIRNRPKLSNEIGLNLAQFPTAPSSPAQGFGVVCVGAPENVSPRNWSLVQSALMSAAQMYRGAQASPSSQGFACYLLPSPADAVKFATVVQHALMCMVPNDSDGVGPKEYSEASSMPVFKGVRVRMALSCGEVLAVELPATQQQRTLAAAGSEIAEPKPFSVSGSAVDQALQLLALINPGQVVLTDTMWAKVQTINLIGTQVSPLPPLPLYPISLLLGQVRTPLQTPLDRHESNAH